ncbi:restriction endonuclease subunit S [Streptococcus suis]|uniref:restriction endonuclease subunit S n=4 Tax=Streptococcus suis TaxID=1307 RepID=UPI0015577028|nr:restriction endonuclease subunit S [Streptococcus suis]MBS8103373.1 restriction endonuclease subunit S [Streptococcus suis]NQP36879.1 restriction endonuclease subunit S [Streptococcus suis]
MTPEQLKASILQRAMEGKLVPQDPTDEPASELLKRIKAEKEKLIADGKIKRDKKETELFRAADGKPYEKLADGTIQEVKVPYYIPDNWEWVRLGFFAEIISGYAYKSKSFEFSGDFQVLRLGNIKNNELRADVQPVYIDKQLAEKTTKVKCLPNDILVTMTGTRGKRDYFYTYRISENNNFYFNQRVGCIRSMTTQIFSQFLSFALKSESILNEIFSHETGTANQGNIGKKEISNILIPLPPFAEQQRIVEQIERALEKVDAYSESYNKLQELDKNFPDKLKKSILQYAMQGKLVPQDPDDEPVEVLLEKIKAEKQKLYEEGKLKKKDLEELVVTKGDDNSPYKEVPYSIPRSWKWVRLNDITSYIQRGKSPKYSTIPKYPVIAQKCNQWSGFSIELAKFVSPDTVDSYQEERLLKDGDLMWNSTGLGTLGRLAIYSEVKNPYGWAVADSHVTIIRLLLKFIDYHFIYHFLASPIVQNVIEEQASGSTKQKELATTTVKNYLIPLPPLTEQQRIVSKISQVFSVIESLV